MADDSHELPSRIDRRDSSRRYGPRWLGSLASFVIVGGLLVAVALGAVLLLLPAAIPNSLMWVLAGLALALLLVGRLLVVSLAKRVCPGWTSLTVRQWWSSQVRRGGLAAAILWIVGVVAAETVGSRPGIGDLQFLLLAVGLVGIVVTLAISYYYRSVANVWLPLVGRPGGCDSHRIAEVALLSSPASRAMSSGVELSLIEGRDVQGQWWEILQETAVFALGDLWLAIYDLRESAPTAGASNLIHLAPGCIQACPQALTLPPGTALGVLEIGQPGALGVVAPPGALAGMAVPRDPEVQALREGFWRNLSSRGLVEVDGQPGMRLRRVVHRGRSESRGM